jgi:hypothetical protein
MYILYIEVLNPNPSLVLNIVYVGLEFIFEQYTYNVYT